MIIRNNICAINAHRNLNYNVKNVAEFVEKLSTGLRIVRAADDAAGLGISERMKSNLTSMKQSIKNSSDSLSLLQTAEGGLQTLHSILDRMLELAEKSKSATLNNEIDRSSLQKEYSSLIDEINNISLSTNYNDIKLLDGSFSTDKKQQTSDMHYLTEFVDNMRNIMNEAIILKNDSAIIFGEGGEFQFFLDSFSSENNAISVNISDMSSAGLSLSSTSISNVSDAANSIEFIKEAIQKVSDARIEIGTAQNRIELSADNLKVSHESLTNSQSRITDMDEARALVETAKSKITAEASEAALAQANIQPLSVLGLLNTKIEKPVSSKEKTYIKSEIPAAEKSSPAKHKVHSYKQTKSTEQYNKIKTNINPQKPKIKANKHCSSFSVKI